MPRSFAVPSAYRSTVLSGLKELRSARDPRRQDPSPALLDCGPLHFYVARHFGFCFGVENAIEIAYRALSENPGRRVFLLSEMIHNPEVNGDLRARGVRFLMTTGGEPLFDLKELNPEDIVIVPAFGTTLEMQQRLLQQGVNPYYYDTTCPFVQKVWKRSSELGRSGYTVIVHGKRAHEETRATFSHSKELAPTLIVRDLQDTKLLVEFLRGNMTRAAFDEHFSRAVSPGFDPESDLRRVGVVNQTTMLATETQEIAELLRSAMSGLYGAQSLDEHFADTRDTLCYATYENQSATRALVAAGADMAVVVGGYNSSNTSHLVELCEEALPTFYVMNDSEIEGPQAVWHFDLRKKERRRTEGWLPGRSPLKVAVTSGASCPDATVELVMRRILAFYPDARSLDDALGALKNCA